MPSHASDLKHDVYKILAWSVCLPALVLWPFLSAMPAFTLLGEGLTAAEFSINVIMLATGFWSIATAYAGYLFAGIKTAGGKDRPSSQRGLLLGAYAVVWTGLYLIVALVTR